MANYNSIEKIISAEILRTNEDNLLANRVCNTSYVGDIRNKGDSVTFIGLSDPTVYDYTGTLNYEEVDDYATTLFVDQDKAFSFKIKDIEELRSSVGLKDSQTKRASYLLKNEVDAYVFGLYPDAGHIFEETTVTPANVLLTVAAIKQKLEEANVPDGRTWIIVPPFIKTKLMLAGIKFQINNDELGCDIFVSNQLCKSGSSTYMLAGSYSAIAYAEQVLETQVIDRMEYSFDKAVRGRLVFGAKVIKPTELVCCPVIDGSNAI